MKNKKIRAVSRDEADHLIIETENQIAVILEPYLVDSIKETFKELGITADDYESFCKELEKNGLPRPANMGLIHGGFGEELTIPDLNQFGHSPTESIHKDPSLFVDEELSISDLFQFELDTNVPLFELPEDLDLTNLFQFDESETKKKKSS